MKYYIPISFVNLKISEKLFRVFFLCSFCVLLSCEKEVILDVKIIPENSGYSIPPNGTYLEGTHVRIEIIPENDYSIVEYYGDVTGFNNPIEVILNSDKRITVTLDIDSDRDGIFDIDDDCLDTPEGEEVDEYGCSDSQKDSDNDGVTDNIDLCPNTPKGEEVDENGCSSSQIILIPDQEFEQYLIDEGYDNQLNGFIYTDSVKSVTSLKIHNDYEPRIIDFTGIKSFEKLKNLELYNNYRTLNDLDLSGMSYLKNVTINNTDGRGNVLNLSNCENLDYVHIEYTLFEILNLSNCSSLTTIDIPHHLYIGELDLSKCVSVSQLNFKSNSNININNLNINGCSNLETIQCNDNQLINLNVNECSKLETIQCYNSQLTSLNIKGCPNLGTIQCNYNQLTSLNVNELSNLEILRCEGNQLTSLNINGCSKLKVLNCYENQLTSLNINGCSKLKVLKCYENQFTSLDVSQNIVLEKLVLYQSPNLFCVKVNQSQLNDIPENWVKDPHIKWSLDCNN